jgi:aminobenzoyl-glutamate utilization protein B
MRRDDVNKGNSPQVWNHVDELAGAFIALSDRIWETPELNYQEFKSSAEHARMLEEQGFRVETNLAGIPTAVMGEAGEGGPIIAFLGEFDALPNLSQESGATEYRPISGDGNGHACGHNLLGSGSMLAAAALKEWLAANKVPGRVRYYGCPAEEGGTGKAFMVRDGVFDDVDIAICWHPFAFSGVLEPLSLANATLDFSFTGRSAHAAASPHLGRSALDAVELMNVGVNYMREHMSSDARVHYAYLDAGGSAPNVVQASATIRYVVRALRAAEVETLMERVRKVAEGAALMTETQVHSRLVCAMNSLLGNRTLEKLMHRNFEMLGAPQFDDDDRDFGRKIQATLTRQHIDTAFAMFGVKPGTSPLCEQIVEFEASGMKMLGSTDVGDVSWAVPTVQASGATHAIGTPLHSWQITAQGKSGLAHKGMVHTAKVMAATAMDLYANRDLIDAAKAEHRDRLEQDPLVRLLPADLKPPIGP